MGWRGGGRGRSWFQGTFILVTFLCGMVGQIIKDIEPGSPAEAAGLKNNDLIVAVNGESVEALDHDGVVELIRKGGDQTTLLVLDKEADRLYSLVSDPSTVYIRALRLGLFTHAFQLWAELLCSSTRAGITTITTIKTKPWLKSAVTEVC